MSNLPATVDPSQFVDKLRERIRSTLGELIPEEQWNKMLAAEVERFMKPRIDGQGYYQRETPSDFTKIAQDVFKTVTEERIKKYLDENEAWKARWNSDSGEPEIPKRLEELIEKNLPLLMRECIAQMFTGIAKQANFQTMMAIQHRMGG